MRVNKLFLVSVFCMLAFGATFAVELTGTTSVNVTSDTAAQAKTRAFNSARRDVITRELRNYANPEQLEAAIKESSNEELMNIISSSSLDSEKISDTSYSANISFVIDGDAARKWMEKYSVQNWLPSSSSVAVVQVANSVPFNVTLLQPMADWASLNAVARDVGADIATVKIVGNNISFVMEEKNAIKFSKALRMNGWRVQQGLDGFKIFK